MKNKNLNAFVNRLGKKQRLDQKIQKQVKGGAYSEPPPLDEVTLCI